MDKDIFKNHNDYWLVSQNIKDLYLSEGSISVLLDFERVLDELDVYAFKNWINGELVAGPEVTKYTATCVFMWPANIMPDPRGGNRLLPFGCKVKFKKQKMQIPIKITSPDDYAPGGHTARLVEQPIWLVEIEMPKALMMDIRTGSVEFENETVDLEDVDASYEVDIDQEEFKVDNPQ